MEGRIIEVLLYFGHLLDFDTSVHTRFIGSSTDTLLLPLKSNTLCLKLGSSSCHFL